MILRIVRGAFPRATDLQAVIDLRDRLARVARDVLGLDSLIVGIRRTGGADDDRIEAAIVTVWRDAETMLRATGTDEQDRFLGARLSLPMAVERSDHYEIVGRTFAALPPDTSAYLRIVRVRGRANEEARLIETLRDQQPRLVQLGLVASHLGRRVVEREVEAVSVAVWPDRDAIRAAAQGGPERPLFAHELEPWADRIHLDTYDGIEIAPRLPLAVGPPIVVFDDDMRIVDITASAAAAMGWATEDLVGHTMTELSGTGDDVFEANRPALMRDGVVAGEGAWHVPDAGHVFLRYVSRRDVPIPGRHVTLVHRWNEPTPSAEDLDLALIDAFPRLDARRPAS